ncbi:MAG: hypothetical protein ACOC4M_17105 [Promethearchaeia archaeon]
MSKSKKQIDLTGKEVKNAITFWVNFSKVRDGGNIDYKVYKTRRFIPMRNSETIKVTVKIPEALFKMTLSAEIEVETPAKFSSEKIADKQLKRLNQDLVEVLNE